MSGEIQQPRGLPGEVAVGHQTADRARTSSSIRAITSSIAELGRVDLDGVRGRLHADVVGLVAQLEVGRERVGADVGPLGLAAARADRRVGDEVDLHLGLRRDDRADVAALDHDVALGPELALALAHHLAHLGVAGDDRDRSGRSAPAGSSR